MRLVGAWGAFVIMASLSKYAHAFPLLQRSMFPSRPKPTKWLVSKHLLATSKTIEHDDAIVEPNDDTFPKIPQEFVNDGPLAWMAYYFDLFGVREGKSIAYGPIPVDIDKSKTTSEEIASALRSEAASNLQNISKEERTRRANASTYTAALTIAYAIWSAVFADEGDLGGHFLRFLTVIPLFFTVGYKLSAETGL